MVSLTVCRKTGNGARAIDENGIRNLPQLPGTFER